MANKHVEKESVEDVILRLPKKEQVIVKRLRSLILECLPHVTEKNSYGVPFYTRHRMMLFIWPPSVYWGNKRYDLETKGVSLGFCQGNKMSNEDGALLIEGRKQVYCMYFKSVNEIHEDQLRALFFEADLVDQEFGKSKKSRRVN